MTAERWARVKVVLYEALQLPPEGRSGFLELACSGEDSLRREVDSMLSSGDRICSGFLESREGHVPAPPGAMLRHYEVRAWLSAGGMGEVYRGHDPRLGRDVAIKVLPRAFANDAERLRRFEQEARATATLNHPNIVVIHDVGTTDDGIPYLVTELLEGETLRQRLAAGPFSIRKTLDVALQIARGLWAAHDKGIVHRDLKPENLFLTNEGLLKILDFGLAKLERKGLSVEAGQTEGTQPGAVMGTLGYMPPEQVRGLATDQRSDIFAAGAIVYEMLSGKRAFQGETGADTIQAILSGDPTPLPELNPTVPPELQRIVERCLEKSPNRRFQSARDFAIALESVSDPRNPHRGERARRRAQPATRTRIYVLCGVAVLLALSAASLTWYRSARRVASPAQEWEQVTNFPDAATFPALSPDGRMLAFLRGANTFVAAGDLYLKLLPNGELVQLTHDGGPKATPTFSPDGSRIAYSTSPRWETWVVPIPGAQPRIMLPNASGLTWVDDRHVLFSEIKSGIHMAVVTATESRGEERDIYVPPKELGMAHRSHLSPDHKWVLISYEMDLSGDMPCRVVPFDGDSLGRVVGPPGSVCHDAGWSSDGNWMFFSARQANSGFHLWRQRFPNGTPQQFTFGPTEEEGIAVEPDGRSILTSVGLSASSVWLHDKAGDHRVPFDGSARLILDQWSSRAHFSPDGRKLYFLGQRGPKDAEELWMFDRESGSIERPLPGISIAHNFDLSMDGKQIVFDSPDARGELHVWIASLDRSSPPRRLVSGMPESFPLFGPTGLFFLAPEGGHEYLSRRPIAGGRPSKVIPSPVVRLETISPDGKWVVAEAPVSGEDVTRGVVAYRLEDGSAIRVCHSLCIVRWTADGNLLYLALPGSGQTQGWYKTFILPLRHGESFPKLPATGIKSESDLAHWKGAQVVQDLARPGPDASVYAFDRRESHRNIYRIPIP
jgi:eukaryotic-like serine/threonine-protein kinase